MSDEARVGEKGLKADAIGYMSNLVGCERGDVVRAIAPVSGGIVASTCKGPVAAWLAHGASDPVVAQSEGIAAVGSGREAVGLVVERLRLAAALCQPVGLVVDDDKA